MSVPGASLRASQRAEGTEPEETGKRNIQEFVRKIRKMSHPGENRGKSFEARRQPVVSNAAETSNRMRPESWP